MPVIVKGRPGTFILLLKGREKSMLLSSTTSHNFFFISGSSRIKVITVKLRFARGNYHFAKSHRNLALNNLAKLLFNNYPGIEYHYAPGGIFLSYFYLLGYTWDLGL
jgi:hypothetical protein